MAISAHSGCSEADTCGAIAVVVPVITVTDGTTGKPICDATVIASCADGGAALVAFGPGGYPVDAAVSGCHYGPGLQNGCDVSTVTVSKTGYKTVTVPNVEVRSSTHCPGPIPDAQQVGVALEPDSQTPAGAGYQRFDSAGVLRSVTVWGGANAELGSIGLAPNGNVVMVGLIEQPTISDPPPTLFLVKFAP